MNLGVRYVPSFDGDTCDGAVIAAGRSEAIGNVTANEQASNLSSSEKARHGQLHRWVGLDRGDIRRRRRLERQG